MTLVLSRLSMVYRELLEEQWGGGGGHKTGRLKKQFRNSGLEGHQIGFCFDALFIFNVVKTVIYTIHCTLYADNYFYIIIMF